METHFVVFKGLMPKETGVVYGERREQVKLGGGRAFGTQEWNGINTRVTPLKVTLKGMAQHARNEGFFGVMVTRELQIDPLLGGKLLGRIVDSKWTPIRKSR